MHLRQYVAQISLTNTETHAADAVFHDMQRYFTGVKILKLQTEMIQHTLLITHWSSPEKCLGHVLNEDRLVLSPKRVPERRGCYGEHSVALGP